MAQAAAQQRCTPSCSSLAGPTGNSTSTGSRCQAYLRCPPVVGTTSIAHNLCCCQTTSSNTCSSSSSSRELVYLGCAWLAGRSSRGVVGAVNRRCG
jgi:hypothetical protein